MVGLTGYITPSDRFKTEKPYRYTGPEIPGFTTFNFEQPMREMPLTDIRTVPDFKPTVNEHGFCFLKNKSVQLAEVTDESNSQPYADEMADVVKKVTGAETVWATNTRLRSAAKEHTKVTVTCDAHSDIPFDEGWIRVRAFLSQEERDLALAGKLRVRVLNLWRPMVNQAEDWPLAVLDPQSVQDPSDAIVVDSVSPTFCAGLPFFKYDPRHRWYWMSNMMPDEIVMFTQYDTHPPGGKFNIVGHAAFRNMDARPGCPPRQSIEARFLLLEPAPYHKDKPFGELDKKETRVQPWKEFIKLADETVPPPVDPSNRKMVFGYKLPPPAPSSAPVKVN